MRYIPVATPRHVDSFPMSLVNPQNIPSPSRHIWLTHTDSQANTGYHRPRGPGSVRPGIFQRMGNNIRKVASLHRAKILEKPFSCGSSLHPSPIQSETERGRPIWNLSPLSRTASPLPLGKYLFGMFLLLDSSGISETQYRSVFPATRDFPRPEIVFVEFAGSSDRSNPANTHRFEVERQTALDNEQRREVTIGISLSSLVVDPLCGSPLPGPVAWFHVLYSRFLFAYGNREVLQQ